MKNKSQRNCSTYLTNNSTNDTIQIVQHVEWKGDRKMGFRIRECRNEINMSQEELSKKSGVSRTIISGLENGTITVTVTTTETLLRIARAMNKKVVDIFFET